MVPVHLDSCNISLDYIHRSVSDNEVCRQLTLYYENLHLFRIIPHQCFSNAYAIFAFTLDKIVCVSIKWIRLDTARFKLW